MTTIETLTDEQIKTLRAEAGQHGDLDMVAICDLATGGDEAARAKVVKVIRNAEAQS